MPLDPQCQAVVDAMANTKTAFESDDPAEARRLYDESTADYAWPRPPLADVTDYVLPGPAGSIAWRLYRPKSKSSVPQPVVFYFHGGGWIFGGLESHDHVCRALAHESGALVALITYRLAPENKFPAGLEDCLAATRWLRDHAEEYGMDPTRIAVAGDSAGGNFAAVVCLALRDAGEPGPMFQYLIYPPIDLTCSLESHDRYAEGYLLTRDVVAHYYGTYLTSMAEAKNPLVSPLLAKSVAGLPPALVQTAEFDPVSDEGAAYAARLRHAGILATHTRYYGTFHGFVRMGAMIDKSAVALSEGAQALRKAFQLSELAGTGA